MLSCALSIFSTVGMSPSCYSPPIRLPMGKTTSECRLVRQQSQMAWEQKTEELNDWPAHRQSPMMQRQDYLYKSREEQRSEKLAGDLQNLTRSRNQAVRDDSTYQILPNNTELANTKTAHMAGLKDLEGDLTSMSCGVSTLPYESYAQHIHKGI